MALWAQEASSDEGRLSQDGRWTEVSRNKEETSLTLGLSPLTPSGLSVLHQSLPPSKVLEREPKVYVSPVTLSSTVLRGRSQIGELSEAVSQE